MDRGTASLILGKICYLVRNRHETWQYLKKHTGLVLPFCREKNFHSDTCAAFTMTELCVLNAYYTTNLLLKVHFLKKMLIKVKIKE